MVERIDQLGQPRGMFYEELPAVGEVLVHGGTYTLTPEDQFAYARITVNPARIHLDDGVARAAGHPGIIANGSHMEAVVMGLTVADLTQGTIFGNMKVATTNPRSIHIGDTIRVETTIDGKRESASKPQLGVVNMTQRGFVGEEVDPAIIVERVVAFQRTMVQ